MQDNFAFRLTNERALTWKSRETHFLFSHRIPKTLAPIFRFCFLGISNTNEVQFQVMSSDFHLVISKSFESVIIQRGRRRTFEVVEEIRTLNASDSHLTKRFDHLILLITKDGQV